MSQPLTWVLVGERTGDNNQVMALAEGLGYPFEVKDLRYNLWRALSTRLQATLLTTTPTSRRQLTPPWPDLIIAIGRRSVPIARWIRKQNDGRSKIVLIGHPRQDPSLFDLVITTRQYPVPPGDNVLVLPVSVSRHAEPPVPTAEEAIWLDGLERPRRVLAIGGATKYWVMRPGTVADALRHLLERDGSVIVAPSRRTDPEVLEAVKDAMVAGRTKMLDGKVPRFATVLGDADEIYVTGDSVSMLSEAIALGKPVGIVPIERNRKGLRQLGSDGPHSSGPDLRRRDLRRFWNYLSEEGLAGTVERPSVGRKVDALAMAVERVRALFA